MITKKLHKQQRGSVYIAVLWTAILAFLAYIAVQIYWNGMGESSGGRGFGIKGKVSSLLRDMEEQGHGDLAKWIMILVCAAAGIYVLTRIFAALRNIAPERTKLGLSLCRQMEPGEDFKELCRQIDLDMEGGYQEFGGIVFVSSSWVLEDEIMRISRVRAICDKTAYGEKTIVLEDVDGNCMTLEFFMQEWAAELMEYFRKTSSTAGLVTGSEVKKAEVGRMYSWHVPKTRQEIEKYLVLASQGDVRAQTEYAKCLLFGKAGLAPDGNAAYAWLQKAAAQSDEIAKMYVGHCLFYGIGVEKNVEEGYRKLNDALEYNYPEDSSSQPLAEYSTFENEDLVQLFWDLGDAFEHGWGVDCNYSVAAYYFNMMDDWGHPEGAERMRSYKKGAFGWKKV